MANQILNCTTAERSTWLAFDDDERRALREHDHVAAVRAGRAPVPDPDPVHRDVRAGPRAAGVPDRVRAGDGAPEPALPRHRHLTAGCPAPRVRRAARSGRAPEAGAAGRRGAGRGAPPRRSSRSTCCAPAATSYFGQPPLPYVPGVQGVGVVAESRRVRRGHAGCGSPPRAGMAPGDGSLAEWCAVPAADLVPISADGPGRGGGGDRHVGDRGLDGADLAGRPAAGERVVVLGANGTVGQVAMAVARAARCGAGGRGVPVGRRGQPGAGVRGARRGRAGCGRGAGRADRRGWSRRPVARWTW